MSTVQRKAFLKKDGFTQHKNNARGNTIIYSRKHSTEKFVRIVVDSGIDKNTNKICGQAKAKLVYVNRENHWRVITKEVSSSTISSLVQSQSNSISSVPQCKHCNAKKFTAKSGNVVCANACWTTWGNKKKTQKKARTYKKKSQKKSQEYYLHLKVGDLVTVENIAISSQKILDDYEGKILGMITKIDDDNNVTTLWTTNTSDLLYLPKSNRFERNSPEYARSWSRFKVMSRKVEWVIK
jgi:hypothetical protein